MYTRGAKALVLTLSLVSIVFAGETFAADKKKKKKGKEPEIEIGQPMQVGDAALTCQQLLAEAGKMEQVIGSAPEGSLLSSEQAAGMAQSAAYRAGAAKLGGALGTAGSLFGGLSKKKKKKQEARRKAAELRWFYVIGNFQGRDCATQMRASAVPEAE